MPGRTTHAHELIDRNRISAAIKLLSKWTRSKKYDGRAAFLLGTLYFRKMYWSDGFKNYELALEREPRYRDHPLLVSNAVAALASRSKPWLARKFILEHLGRRALPDLEQAAKGGVNKHHREQAARVIALLEKE